MKKFEDELQDSNLEILVSNTGSSLYGQSYVNYDKVVKISKGWVSPRDHIKVVAGLTAEIEKTELQNFKYREEIARMQKSLRKKNKAIKERAELKRENEELKSQLEKQKPEIPEFVAKAVMEINLGYLFNGFTNGINKKAKEWLEKHKGAKSLGYYVCQLRFQGFTVAKEKRFYLKAKELLVVGEYDHVEDLWLDFNKNYTPKKSMAHKFTQKEIDSMETGSYEQISVEENKC